MRIVMICAAALVACSACASMVPSPVTAEYRSGYSLNAISVQLPDPNEVPARHDAAVNYILALDDPSARDDAAAFRRYADGRGGLTPDNAGALFLEYRVASQLEEQLPALYTGDRAADLQITIVSLTFPTAAAMMEIGEVIETRFLLTLTDTQSGTVLVHATSPLFPFVKESEEAEDGLLAVTPPRVQNWHVPNLQRIAAAISDETVAVLAGQPIYQHNFERLALNPIQRSNDIVPTRETGGPASD